MPPYSKSRGLLNETNTISPDEQERLGLEHSRASLGCLDNSIEPIVLTDFRQIVTFVLEKYDTNRG